MTDQVLILFFKSIISLFTLEAIPPSRRGGPRRIWILENCIRQAEVDSLEPGNLGHKSRWRLPEPVEVAWEWSPAFVHSGKLWICRVLPSSFCPACQSPAYPSTKGGSLSHPGSGEYFQRVVALSSSLAASDHNKLCTALWDCDTRRWRSSRGGWKSIIWNFCFFFLLGSMLLRFCHLSPSLPPSIVLRGLCLTVLF